MSRYFMINSWVGSHENEPEYNGNMCGERNTRSIEVVPLYDRFGNANVSAFSDAAIAARNGLNKKTTSSPLADRILPQQRRVRVLTEQLCELEAERKNGLDIQTYSQLRDVLIVKRDRAEVLLQKALSVRPIRSETDEDSGLFHTSSGFSPSPNDGYAPEEYEEIGVRFIDQLSETNCLKNTLKKACVVCRTLVKWHNRTKAYVQTLKEV